MPENTFIFRAAVHTALFNSRSNPIHRGFLQLQLALVFSSVVNHRIDFLDELTRNCITGYHTHRLGNAEPRVCDRQAPVSIWLKRTPTLTVSQCAMCTSGKVHHPQSRKNHKGSSVKLGRGRGCVSGRIPRTDHRTIQHKGKGSFHLGPSKCLHIHSSVRVC